MIPEVRSIRGEPFRLYVRSKTNPKDEYLVDLEEHKGNGACGCQRFMFSCFPTLKKNQGRTGNGTRCSHILKARDHWTDDMIKRLSKEFYGKQAKTIF